MISEIRLRVAVAEYSEPTAVPGRIVKALKISAARLRHFEILRRSIDARMHPPVFELLVKAWVDEDPTITGGIEPELKDVRGAAPAIIVGLGPAGLFCALRLIELGIRPVVLERGKPVRERRRSIARINKEGVVDPNSNYCFGEGGAGTFSDGKLYTRSTKRGSVRRVLELLVHYGAQPEILVDAHPHIGTNRLPNVVQAIRNSIIDCGGEIHFDTVCNGLLRSGTTLNGVTSSGGERFDAKSVVVASGHSARDVFGLLLREKLTIELKPFALGVRVEHPQEFVDRIQYRCEQRPAELPAASYALRHQSAARGVFSFCMCPGGIICPASTSDDAVVVNGWSPSKRNSKFANSGIVVELTAEDLANFEGSDPLAGVRYQSRVEQAAAEAGGGRQVAPGQRLTDFVANRSSSTLPGSSYLPGLAASNLREVLPAAIGERLTAAFAAFNRKLKGYIQEDAVVVGVESRTSSPVRIPRSEQSLFHPELQGLVPTGEGAGFAGGIVSAAMDGIRAAEAIRCYYDQI